MSATRFTPGPWEVETWGSDVRGEAHQVAAFSEDGNRTLCCVVESSNKFDDARLIAKAPEMFKVCQTLVNIPHIEEAATGELKAALDLAKAVVSETQGYTQ